jgi:hypothetical protein
MNAPMQDPTEHPPTEQEGQDPSTIIDAIIQQLNDLKTQLSGEEQQETPSNPAGPAPAGGKPYGKAPRSGLAGLLGG